MLLSQPLRSRWIKAFPPIVPSLRSRVIFKSVGSDTLGHETALWASAFEKLYPDVKIDVEVEGLGDGAAGAARRCGAVRPDVAADDGRGDQRRSKRNMATRFRSFRVAVDALAVYVNKDNPIPCLTIPQVSGIFASERSRPPAAPTSGPGATSA